MLLIVVLVAEYYVNTMGTDLIVLGQEIEFITNMVSRYFREYKLLI